MHTAGVVTPRKRYTFFIDPALDEGLKALKQRDGTPESEAIRRAIAEYLERRGVWWKKKTDRPGPTSTRKRS